jgi:ribosomal protein L11 methyltransferase
MPDLSWLEVSLILDGELAEAVSEVMARFAPDGVVIESTAVTSNPDDSEGHAVGPLRVCAYLLADDNVEETRKKLAEALWYLGRISPIPEPQYRRVQQSDWAETWKQHYQPIAIGKSLMIIPAWLESPDPDRIPVRIDPGMAFGTGTHPTTQLCLELLEEAIERAGGMLEGVIDVGCGSGILSTAAIKLGVRRALGVDVDPEAITACRENAALNGVEAQQEGGLGSVAEIRSGAFSIQRAPLVLANILATVVIRLLDEGLGELVTPGGSLVLSGILEEQSPEVEVALIKHGFQLVDKRQSGDWVALLARSQSAYQEPFLSRR